MLLLSITLSDIFHPFIALLSFLGIGLNGFIYKLLSFTYQVFFAVSSARILREESYVEMANKIYLVIGVVALFLVAYGLLQAIINPENAKGKSDTALNNMISRVITAIVLIAFVPTIFNFAYKIQEVVIDKNIIGNIMLHGTTEDDDNVSKEGYQFANTIFMYFFLPVDDEGNADCLDAGDENFKDCLNKVESDSSLFTAGLKLGDVYGEVNENGNFSRYSKFSENVADGQIDFNFLMQLIVGIFITYIFVSFCIDMGLRAAKLAYYQIIAPLPILTLIIPGQKKIFDNWKKNTISTFADVFIRIMVVYFVIFLIKSLPNIGDDFWNGAFGGELSTGVKLFARIFIILGLLMFMKQAPKLLGDMFGVQAGSFKLGIGEKLKEATDFSKVPVVGRAQGALTGAAGAGWTAARNGANVGKAMLWGGYQGGKAKGSQFNKQRKSIWTDVYEMKGPAGVFGGRAWVDRKTGEWKNKMNDEFLQYDPKKGEGANSKILRKIESTKPFTDYIEKYKDNATNLINDLAKKERPYNLQIEAEEDKINIIGSELRNKTLQLNGLNSAVTSSMGDINNDYVTFLKKARDNAATKGNTAQVMALNQKITDAENGKSNKEALDYVKKTNVGKYNAYQNLVKNRNTTNNEVNTLNKDLQTSQATLDSIKTSKASNADIIAAQKAVTDLGILKDASGNKLEVKSSVDISSKDIDDYAFNSAKKDFRKDNYEYSWRIEAEEKEQREVEIKEAKKDVKNQALGQILSDAVKKNSSDDKK